LPLQANGISSVLYDSLSVLHALWKKTDVLLILGVSGAVILPFARFIRPRARILCNIDGLEWRRAKWGKWAARFLKWSEKIAVKYADHIIADNGVIQKYVAEEYDIKASLIAYGGDHAVLSSSTTESDEVSSSYALALCRIEPENNVHLILEGCSRARMPLKFIGNWNNSDYGIQLRRRYEDDPHIEIVDPIYDLHELYRYRSNCTVYIHGHSAGGTNPSLVEMMHFCKPIIAFDCSYNRASTDNLALYFSDAKTLSTLLERPLDQSALQANKLRELARQRYTWQGVKSGYEALIYKY
jgi:glycosyltransferase involved in cell wall biosynthesis